MLLKIEFYFIVVLTCFSYSCNFNNTEEQTNNKNIPVAAYINNTPIYITEIDEKIRQELYDELNRIYIIRKLTLNEIIREYLLKNEAQKHGISKKELTDNYYLKNVTDSALKKYASDHQLKYIPELKRSLKYYDVNSEEGRDLLIDGYKKYLLNKYIDSLKKEYDINILLKPPLHPNINLNNIIIHYRGNLNSQVKFIEISDLECDKCIEFTPIYKKLYTKYKDRVKFGYTHFSTYVTLSAIATECAAKQDKFWEMKDSIIYSKSFVDTSDIFEYAKNLNLDMSKFISDFKDSTISDKIQNNFDILKSFGLYGVPTIIINDRLIFNSSSIEEIEQVLIEEINKKSLVHDKTQ